MDIYIKWNKEKSGFKLPVLPETYTIDGKQQNTAVNIHAMGQLNLKGKRALIGISWSSFFPGQEYSFAKDTFQDPIKFYVTILKTLMEDNTTIHLVIGTRINIFGTIESFTWSEDGRNGDIAYDISIREYREPGTLVRIKRYFDDNYSVEYKWKKNDTWKSVCKKQLGDASLASKNQKANKKVINKAIKAYKKKKKIKKTKTIKENVALVGYKVVLKI